MRSLLMQQTPRPLAHEPESLPPLVLQSLEVRQVPDVLTVLLV